MTMGLILIGNAVALIGAALMVAIGFIKDKKRILVAQCAQLTILGVANFLLGGMSGVVSNAVGIVRNVIGIKREFTTPYKIFFIVLQGVLTILANNQGWLGYLPLIACATFTWFLDEEDPVKFKAVIIGGQILWGIYDFSILNFSAGAFDIFTCISNLIGIWRVKHAIIKQDEECR